MDGNAFSLLMNLKNSKKSASLIETLPMPTQCQQTLVSPVLYEDEIRTPDLPILSPSITKLISHDFSALTQLQHQKEEESFHIPAKGVHGTRGGSIPSQKVMPLISSLKVKKQTSVKVDGSIQMRAIEED